MTKTQKTNYHLLQAKIGLIIQVFHFINQHYACIHISY
jgi:hypothetical protein